MLNTQTASGLSLNQSWLFSYSFLGLVLLCLSTGHITFIIIRRGGFYIYPTSYLLVARGVPSTGTLEEYVYVYLTFKWYFSLIQSHSLLFSTVVSSPRYIALARASTRRLFVAPRAESSRLIPYPLGWPLSLSCCCCFCCCYSFTPNSLTLGYLFIYFILFLFFTARVYNYTVATATLRWEN